MWYLNQLNRFAVYIITCGERVSLLLCMRYNTIMFIVNNLIYAITRWAQGDLILRFTHTCRLITIHHKGVEMLDTYICIYTSSSRFRLQKNSTKHNLIVHFEHIHDSWIFIWARTFFRELLISYFAYCTLILDFVVCKVFKQSDLGLLAAWYFKFWYKVIQADEKFK